MPHRRSGRMYGVWGMLPQLSGRCLVDEERRRLRRGYAELGPRAQIGLLRRGPGMLLLSGQHIDKKERLLLVQK